MSASSSCRSRTSRREEKNVRILLVWLLNALALIAVAYLMPSIDVTSFWSALVAALVLGLLNAVIRPLLILLTLPATLLTLGLFIFVINALLFWLVGSFVEGFVVGGFWAAFFGAILFSIVSWLLSALVLKSGR
jgi:putative membrane protein